MAGKVPHYDLTSTFLKCRSEHIYKKRKRFGQPLFPDSLSPASERDIGTVRLLGNERSHHVAIEMESIHRRGSQNTTLPPLWFDTMAAVQEETRQIRSKIVLLQKLQQKRLMKVFGSQSSMVAPDRDMEKQAQAITSMLKRIEEKIFTIAQPGADVLIHQEKQIRLNAQRAAASELQLLTQEFRKQQNDYMEELRKRQSANLALFDNTTAAGLPLGNGGGFGQSLQEQQLDTMEENVSQRGEEIARIATTIADIHTLFKEVSVLVIDQGSMLDRIDYNLEQVVDRARQTNMELRKAEEYQKSGFAKRIIQALSIGIVILTIILIVKLAIKISMIKRVVGRL